MTKQIPCMCQPSTTLYPNTLHHVGDPCCERVIVDDVLVPEEHRHKSPGLVGTPNDLLFKHPCGTYTQLKQPR